MYLRGYPSSPNILQTYNLSPLRISMPPTTSKQCCLLTTVAFMTCSLVIVQKLVQLSFLLFC